MERKYKLLLADDDRAILTDYGDYFSQRGFLVEVARDGLEGLQKLKEGEFDVAIVDLKLPPQDGLDLVRQAHLAGVNADMIIFTRRDEYDKEDAVAAIKVGISDWFDKANLDKYQFFQRVKELAEGVPLETVSRILSVIRE